MSDHIRRMRALQRAKTAERVARGLAVQSMRELQTVVEQQLAGIDRDDGMHDAVDIDALAEAWSSANARAQVHAAAYSEMAELEGPVQP